MATSKQLQYVRRSGDGPRSSRRPERDSQAVYPASCCTTMWDRHSSSRSPSCPSTTSRARKEPSSRITRAKCWKPAGPALTLVELGAGTANKTRILIDELLQRQTRALFYPIDVSSAALNEAVSQMAVQFPQLRVSPVVADYSGGVPALSRISGRKLVLFIGSSIGNYDPPEAIAMLRRIRRSLRAGDALLLGADLAKSSKILLPAYDDAQGVTAEFNKNILARLNRELDADFNLDAFRHVALWNKRCSRMEIYLESTTAQSVFLPAIDMDVRFGVGERIHTENSYKYTDEMVNNILSESGFKLERTWSDPKRWFGVHLARV